MRSSSHFQKKEPPLEKIVRNLRFKRIEKNLSEKMKLLDLGCGFDAGFLKRNEEKILLGVGMDISVDKSLETKKITLLEGDLNKKLPFPDDYFDLVVSLANLEHLDNWELSLSEAHRVLKPQGKLLLTAPSVYSKPVLEFLSFKLNLISRREIADHKRYFNRRILVGQCRKIGFSSCKHRYFQLFMNNFLIAQK